VTTRLKTGRNLLSPDGGRRAVRGNADGAPTAGFTGKLARSRLLTTALSQLGIPAREKAPGEVAGGVLIEYGAESGENLRILRTCYLPVAAWYLATRSAGTRPRSLMS